MNKKIETMLLSAMSSLLVIILAIFAYPDYFNSSPNFPVLIKKLNNSVVSVAIYETNKEQPETTPSALSIFGIDNEQDSEELVQKGMGSGFIISNDGYILTNAHVVDGGEIVKVLLNNGEEVDAKVIGSDKKSDVALLKIEEKNLKPVSIGDSDEISAGEWVFAMGSPYGLDKTVTAGIISTKERETGEFLSSIQTDVAINPGNSGGPLFNSRGEVIGINSSIYTRSGGYQGIAFSIPINDAVVIAAELREKGKITRGRIGVAVDNLSKREITKLKIPTKSGVKVKEVYKDSPAANAGLLVNDIILYYNQREIHSHLDLSRAVAQTKPGETSVLKIVREGKILELTITIGSLDE
jgi:serine protease Do